MRAVPVLLSMAMLAGCATTQSCDECCDGPYSAAPSYVAPHGEPMAEPMPGYDSSDVPAPSEPDMAKEAPAKPAVDDLPKPE